MLLPTFSFIIIIIVDYCTCILVQNTQNKVYYQGADLWRRYDF